MFPEIINLLKKKRYKRALKRKMVLEIKKLLQKNADNYYAGNNFKAALNFLLRIGKLRVNKTRIFKYNSG